MIFLDVKANLLVGGVLSSATAIINFLVLVIGVVDV